MKTYAVITTGNEKIYKDYGRENIISFLKHWPKEIKIHVFLENYSEESFDKERLFFYDLHKQIPELVKLKERNKTTKEVILKKHENELKNINSKPNKDKSYLYDYVRFANKSYVIIYGLQNIDVDYLIWLDMDVKTIKNIPYSFLEKICPNDSLVSYLKRKNYTETGFLAFNRRHQNIKEYVEIVKDIYDNDKVYTIEYFKKGYTDCHVFDFALNKILLNNNIKVNNLNVRNEESHPFINSELGIYMDHFKGERRKLNKRSDPSEVKNTEILNLNPEYWGKRKEKPLKEKVDIENHNKKNISSSVVSKDENKIKKDIGLKNNSATVVEKNEKIAVNKQTHQSLKNQYKIKMNELQIMLGKEKDVERKRMILKNIEKLKRLLKE